MKSDSDDLNGLDKGFSAAQHLSVAELIGAAGDDNASQETGAPFQEFATRFASARLFRVLIAWQRARRGELLPPLECVDIEQADMDFVATVSVDEATIPMTFELTKVGAEMVRRAETDFDWWDRDASGENGLPSQEGAYRWCVRSKTIAFDFAGSDFGPLGRTFYKRLLLPCSDDGVTVSSLIVVIDFHENRLNRQA